jgi:hypothetical protein
MSATTLESSRHEKTGRCTALVMFTHHLVRECSANGLVLHESNDVDAVDGVAFIITALERMGN